MSVCAMTDHLTDSHIPQKEAGRSIFLSFLDAWPSGLAISSRWTASCPGSRLMAPRVADTTWTRCWAYSTRFNDCPWRQLTVKDCQELRDMAVVSGETVVVSPRNQFDPLWPPPSPPQDRHWVRRGYHEGLGCLQQLLPVKT